ncbi:unnamed protein product [Cladocopium goreaui]|uniref:Uncharacterized protein n=1 Tax=Cladocopium goreaui TaxID=2562237 RepID=A0A9P1FKI2_9DINO|nr:unnamed protein product [Cladocopium goreaui]|mmetsp:Transcript_61668/g.135098  ORF Transcript_61668/g.135098 Transcript_61668/m.135098 type:complete len:274 (-) Transcript_61668:67-888(-)
MQRQFRAGLLVTSLAALGSVALWFSQAPRSFVSAQLPGLNALCVTRGAEEKSLVACHSETEGREWKGSSRYPRYEGFVFRRKKRKGMRLRLARWGSKHKPEFRIHAVFGKHLGHKSGRFNEVCGFYDPLREFDDPWAFKIKADRCVYWLRKGAQPTPQVANLLDIAGIIRRTGVESRMGEWEWRVDPMSGPEAPEGWKYDGPHSVTWGNKPKVHNHKGQVNVDVEKIRKIPLIERYGFRGYTRIPVDEVALSDPLSKSPLLESFPNTELPVYE